MLTAPVSVTPDFSTIQRYMSPTRAAKSVLCCTGMFRVNQVDKGNIPVQYLALENSVTPPLTPIPPGDGTPYTHFDAALMNAAAYDELIIDVQPSVKASGTTPIVSTTQSVETYNQIRMSGRSFWIVISPVGYNISALYSTRDVALAAAMAVMGQVWSDLTNYQMLHRFRGFAILQPDLNIMFTDGTVIDRAFQNVLIQACWSYFRAACIMTARPDDIIGLISPPIDPLAETESTSQTTTSSIATTTVTTSPPVIVVTPVGKTTTTTTTTTNTPKPVPNTPTVPQTPVVCPRVTPQPRPLWFLIKATDSTWSGTVQSQADAIYRWAVQAAGGIAPFPSSDAVTAWLKGGGVLIPPTRISYTIISDDQRIGLISLSSSVSDPFGYKVASGSGSTSSISPYITSDWVNYPNSGILSLANRVDYTYQPAPIELVQENLSPFDPTQRRITRKPLKVRRESTGTLRLAPGQQSSSTSSATTKSKSGTTSSITTTVTTVTDTLNYNTNIVMPPSLLGGNVAQRDELVIIYPNDQVAGQNMSVVLGQLASTITPAGRNIVYNANIELAYALPINDDMWSSDGTGGVSASGTGDASITNVLGFCAALGVTTLGVYNNGTDVPAPVQFMPGDSSVNSTGTSTVWAAEGNIFVAYEDTTTGTVVRQFAPNFVETTPYTGRDFA